MKTKPKLILCAVGFIIGGILNVFFSTALHNAFTQRNYRLEFTGFFECIRGMAGSNRHLMLFLCVQGFILILAVVFFLTNMRPYQSSLVRITPEIETPAPVGQYQHGSAKWLEEKEKDKVFDAFDLDPYESAIRDLIKSGYEGLDFLDDG